MDSSLSMIPLSSRETLRPGVTHIHRSECVERVVTGFLEAGSTTGLDTACLGEPYRWEFFVPEEAAPTREERGRG
jgi:hypothetical protein